MKKNWDLEELIESFTFMPNELDLLKDKTKETQLGFAVLFKFFQYKARFPSNKKEVPKGLPPTKRGNPPLRNKYSKNS